jgi:hypothetical protein
MTIDTSANLNVNTIMQYSSFGYAPPLGDNSLKLATTEFVNSSLVITNETFSSTITPQNTTVLDIPSVSWISIYPMPTNNSAKAFVLFNTDVTNNINNMISVTENMYININSGAPVSIAFYMTCSLVLVSTPGSYPGTYASASMSLINANTGDVVSQQSYSVSNVSNIPLSFIYTTTGLMQGKYYFLANATSNLINTYSTTAAQWYNSSHITATVSDLTITQNAYLAKSFIIPNPVDKSKYLVHACLEGPESGVYYRGKGEITDNVSTCIELPHYVKYYANEFTIHITPSIKKGFISQRTLMTDEVEDGKFNVYGTNGPFYWIVYASRGAIEVEPNIDAVTLKGDGPYRWI